MSGSKLIVSSNKDFKKLYHLIAPDPLEKKMITAIIGDGSVPMNVQELETIKNYPVFAPVIRIIFLIRLF